MSLMSSVIRTMKRSEISAEFFSYPQKWATGLSEDNEIADKWRASMATLIAITKDEDGDKPTFGQFMQQSMTPHTDHLKMFASISRSICVWRRITGWCIEGMTTARVLFSTKAKEDIGMYTIEPRIGSTRQNARQYRTTSAEEKNLQIRSIMIK